jgi:mono/diheme cytochrome c family protein
MSATPPREVNATRAPLAAAALFAALSIGASLLLSAACSSPRRGELARGPKVFSKEERRGEIVFARHCHSCHPSGGGGLGPAIVNKPLPGFAIRAQVREGIGSMPAFPEHRLSDDDLDAVVKYIQAMHSR